MQETNDKNQRALDVDREFVRGDIIDFLSRFGVNSTKTGWKERIWVASERKDIQMVIFPRCHHDRMILAMHDADHHRVHLSVFEMKPLGSSCFDYSEGDE